MLEYLKSNRFPKTSKSLQGAETAVFSPNSILSGEVSEYLKLLKFKCRREANAAAFEGGEVSK